VFAPIGVLKPARTFVFLLLRVFHRTTISRGRRAVLFHTEHVITLHIVTMQDSNRRIRRVEMPWETRKVFAIVIYDVFTKEECDAFIARSEEQGYEEALVNIGGGQQQKMTDFRNSDRCIIDDPVFAQEMWRRILEIMTSASPHDDIGQDKLHSPAAGFTAVGLNERLRILRYGPGTFFKPHYDGAYVRGTEAGLARMDEKSFVTCQLYLNEDCTGGETRFLSPNVASSSSKWSERKRLKNTKSAPKDSSLETETKVVPKTGSVLLFEHELLHEGCEVVDGKKYVIRTDVMYTRKGLGHEYSSRPIGGASASNSFETVEED